VTAGSPQRSKKHVVQWNPVVLRILSWRREEAKREEVKEKTTKQPLRQRQLVKPSQNWSCDWHRSQRRHRDYIKKI